MSTVIRAAIKADSTQLAALMDIASQGFAMHVWQARLAFGHSAVEHGRARIRNAVEESCHFTSWTVFENDAEIWGACSGQLLANPDVPIATGGKMVAIAPLLLLEEKAQGCWFLQSLAVFPEFRHMGIGTQLLHHACSQAVSQGAPLALIVRRDNHAARALYAAFGLQETARHPLILPDGQISQDEWLLLIKEKATQR